MDADYQVAYGPVTPDYVLAVLQDTYGPCSSASPVLSFTTTIHQWRNNAFDLPGWRRLARIFNEWWDIRCSKAQWYAVLEPAKQRCLGDVCRLIATHARRPKIRLTRLLGCECRAAGAFLTVRALLHQAGADGKEIAPSMLLEPFILRFGHVVSGPIARLGWPGVVPLPQVTHPADRLGWALLAIVATICFLGTCAGFDVFAVGLVALPIVALILLPLPSLFIPKRAHLGSLRTFRDLAVALAKDSRICHGQ